MLYPASVLHPTAEVQSNVFWEVTFSGAPFRNAEDLKKRCTGGALPSPEHKALEVNAHGFKFYAPGIVEYSGELEINFYESVTAEIADNMQQWYQDCYQYGGGDVQGKRKVGYDACFGEIKIELQDNQDSTKQTYTLKKVLLKKFEPGAELAPNSEELGYFKPKMTVFFNWFDWSK